MGQLIARCKALDSSSSRTTLNSSMLDIRAGFCNADPITREGKKIQMTQMLVIPMIPVTIFIILIATNLGSSNDEQRILLESHDIIDKAGALGEMIYALQVERAATTLFIVNNEVSKHHRLDQSFLFSDKALKNVSSWSNSSDVAEKLQVEIRTYRQRLIEKNLTMAEDVTFYNDAITRFFKILVAAVKDTPSLEAWRQLLAYRLLVRANEDYSAAGLLGLQFFPTGNLSPERRNDFVRLGALGADHVKMSKQYSKEVQQLYKELYLSNAVLLKTIAAMRSCVITVDCNTTAYSRLAWMTTSVSVTDVIANIAREQLHSVSLSVDRSLTDARLTFAVNIVVLALVLIGAPSVTFFIYRMTHRIQEYAVGLSDKTKELRREKKKSDSLLYQMLPKSVALQLKLSKKVSAEVFNHVTIFFSDVVGFTSISSKCTPMQVVDFLNALYLLFDTTINRYDVYKVETIGDAYMIASGLPQRNGKRHAGEIAGVALELLDGIKVFQIPNMPEEKFRLRIGLHTGSVVAGVVGSKMPRFCLFGDTVHIASSMESHGVPLKIHITTECKDALEDLGDYIIERRGVIEVKGLGPMETFFVDGKITRRPISRAFVGGIPIMDAMQQARA
ncbi:hypothetical protein LSAT2_002553 [Lamellibrachia satsuma]|nr:hypothetical protein LSAT2_002553 [Lamellibrachia satsuma]